MPGFRSMLIMEFVLTAVFLVLVAEVSASDSALLRARSVKKDNSDETAEVCIHYNSKYQHLPSSVQDATYHRLVDLSKSDGCNAQDYLNPPSPLENSIVSVMRGNCNFVDKGVLIEAVKGAAALVVDRKNSSTNPVPGGNSSEYDSINITVATVAWEDFNTILSLPGPIEVALYAPPQPIWDPNMFLIIIVSTALVMIGAGLAAYDVSRPFKGSRRRHSKSSDGTENIECSPEEEEAAQINVLGVIIWFVMICVVIILLYFFYYMVYFFIAAFCIAGSYSLYQCLLPVWSRVVPISYDIPLNRLPCIKSKVKLRSFLLLMPCLTLGIFWAIERHAKYAWTIQDLFGFAFCIFFIQNLRLPNMKVIAVLLVLLLIYDVFFVFITPLFTKNGESVMESVATGNGPSKEMLPMVFIIPRLAKYSATQCMRGYSLLGFGDVIIPGILVAYNAVFDVKKGTKMVYFITSSTGYFVGMIVCMISLIYMNSGQPALLYLVPGTLFTTVFVALIRKEFGMLFFGLHQQKFKNLDSMESQVKEADEVDVNNDSLDEEQRNLIN